MNTFIKYLQSRPYFELMNVIKALCAINSFFLFLGFFGRWVWFFDNIQNFLIHQLTLACLFFFVFLFRSISWSCFSLSIILIASVYVFHRYTPSLQIDNENTGPTYKILSFNVLTSNIEHKKFIEFVNDINPDFILLLEVDKQWMNAVEPIKKLYSSSVERVRPDNFGIAFLSKYPISTSRIISFGDYDIPSTIANLKFDEKKLTIIGTHTLPPISKTYWSDRNRHLIALKKKMDEYDDQGLIAAGDLNVTPWSEHGSQFSGKGGYLNIYDMLFNPSWPSKFYPFGIPIDFIMYNSYVEKVNYRVGNDLGSDHLPVILEFKLKKLE